MLRVIGDVHGQVDEENLARRNARPYLELIAEVGDSVQIGDMGDAETYATLLAHVDATHHRFLPGNHDHYNSLPIHSLGDFGTATLGGVMFFFVRGAASEDRNKLLRLGRELGKTLWFEEEELSADQMLDAEEEYLRTRPLIVISHDGPGDIARFACEHARRSRMPDPDAVFRPSRTNRFLARLLAQHQPRLWLFGHHHHDWRYRDGELARPLAATKRLIFEVRAAGRSAGWRKVSSLEVERRCSTWQAEFAYQHSLPKEQRRVQLCTTFGSACLGGFVGI